MVGLKTRQRVIRLVVRRFCSKFGSGWVPGQIVAKDLRPLIRAANKDRDNNLCSSSAENRLLFTSATRKIAHDDRA